MFQYTQKKWQSFEADSVCSGILKTNSSKYVLQYSYHEIGFNDKCSW